MAISIALIITAAVIFAVTVVVVLKWSDIKKWFESWNKNNLTDKDKDDVGFTLQQKIKEKKYKTIQGVFNKRTNKVKDGRVVMSEKIGSKLKGISILLAEDDEFNTMVIEDDLNYFIKKFTLLVD